MEWPNHRCMGLYRTLERPVRALELVEMMHIEESQDGMDVVKTELGSDWCEEDSEEKIQVVWP
jgi:hypothetical protein